MLHDDIMTDIGVEFQTPLFLADLLIAFYSALMPKDGLAYFGNDGTAKHIPEVLIFLRNELRDRRTDALVEYQTMNWDEKERAFMDWFLGPIDPSSISDESHADNDSLDHAQ